MATMNPFDLLGDDDSDDLSKLIAAQKAAPKKETPTAATIKVQQPAAKLPAKPVPPAQSVREAKTESGRQGGRGGDRGDRGYGRGGDRGNNDRGYGRGGGGGGGYNKDQQPKENSFNEGGYLAVQGGKEDADGGKSFERRGGYNTGPPRSSFRGGRRGGDFNNNGEAGNEERPRRNYERRSGTGRGYEVKREGAGRGNWGTASDEITQESAEVVAETEKNVDAEKPSGEEAKDVNKEAPANVAEEKEPEEDKEMTLQEYEKVLEEKRKALQALKTTEERKVDDRAFATMQALSNKKKNDEVFAKLGSDKKKEIAEKEEKTKKAPVSINDFLKPAEGEKYYGSSGRRGGRGGGRGSRDGGFGGGGRTSYRVEAPKIEDPSQFPVLGAK